MKSIILALTLLFISCSSNSDGRFVIEGQTSELDGKYYYLLDELKVLDSAKIENGRYRFEGLIDSIAPLRNISSTDCSSPLITTRFTYVVLEEGTIHVKEDDNSPTGGLVVYGTDANDALNNFAVKGSQIREKLKFATSKEERTAIMEEYSTLVEKTIENNLDNYAGVQLLSVSGSRFSNMQKTKYLNRLSKEMKKTRAAKALIREQGTQTKQK